MGEPMGSIRTESGAVFRRPSAYALQTLFLLSGLIFATPAASQDAGSPSVGQTLPASTPVPPCIVAKQALAADAQPVLLAGCRGHGFILGPATDFQVYRDDDLQATVVDIHNGEQRRVLLLTYPAADHPVLEDITGDIAMSVGRGPGSAIADLDIDFTGIGANGIVSAHSPQGSVGNPASIRLSDHIAAERAVLSAATAAK